MTTTGSHGSTMGVLSTGQSLFAEGAEHWNEVPNSGSRPHPVGLSMGDPLLWTLFHDGYSQFIHGFET